MKILVVYNPAAGQRDKSAEIGQLAGFLTERGCTVAGVEPTHGHGDATTFARRAVALGCNAVLAAGGDGTMSEVVDGLVGTEVALGVLPAGTGNVMARQLGLPVPGSIWPPYSLLTCAQMLLEGSTRKVDVGRVSLAGAGGLTHYCLCWVGVGFDAQVNLAVNQELERKHRLGWLAFVVAAAITLRDYAGTAAVVRADGRRVSRRLIMLVANNIQLYGVFMKMAPRALFDDGMLDIYCFRGRGAAHTLLHAIRVLLNQHLVDPDVDIFRARRLEIKTARPLPVHVDGEPIGYTPVVIDVVPRALSLLVPTSAPATLFSTAGRPGEPPDRQPSSQTAIQDIQRITQEKGDPR